VRRAQARGRSRARPDRDRRRARTAPRGQRRVIECALSQEHSSQHQVARISPRLSGRVRASGSAERDHGQEAGCDAHRVTIYPRVLHRRGHMASSAALRSGRSPTLTWRRAPVMPLSSGDEPYPVIVRVGDQDVTVGVNHQPIRAGQLGRGGGSGLPLPAIVVMIPVLRSTRRTRLLPLSAMNRSPAWGTHAGAGRARDRGSLTNRILKTLVAGRPSVVVARPRFPQSADGRLVHASG
jgi:hypothetical protein